MSMINGVSGTPHIVEVKHPKERQISPAFFQGIHPPSKKMRGFDTSNLTRQTGFFKHFKYLFQILRRFTNDKYLGLRNAVEIYNKDKTEENLDKIISHIELVKNEDFETPDGDSLVRTASEAVLLKTLGLIERTEIPFYPTWTVKLKKIGKNKELNGAIDVFNKAPTKKNALEVLKTLKTWIEKHPSEHAGRYGQVQTLFYQISMGFHDEKLHGLFHILEPVKILNNRTKLQRLSKMSTDKISKNSLNLPKIDLFFAFLRAPAKVNKALSSFNQYKSEEALEAVLDALITWQNRHPHRFNRSNGEKLLREIEKILKGETKQSKINKMGSFQFLDSPMLEGVEKCEGLPHLKSQHPSEKLQEVNKSGNLSAIKDWVLSEPDEFFAVGGEKLLNTIRKKTLAAVNSDFQPTLSVSSGAHPEKVIERNLGFHPEEGTNGYIVVFHNPVAPWSHTEFVVAKSEMSKDDLATFNGLEDIDDAEEYVAAKDKSAWGDALEIKEKLPKDNSEAIFAIVEPYLKDKKLQDLSQSSPLWKELEDFPLAILAIIAKPDAVFTKESFIEPVITQARAKEIYEMKDRSDLEPMILGKILMIKDQSVLKREYLGIGADGPGLDEISQYAEGVRISDSRLVNRMEKLCSKRKNPIQKQMNIFVGIKAGLRSMAGERSKLLRGKDEKKRHLKLALIDNFMTNYEPKAFLPNLDEPRYRLELYESGGEVYRRWIEDEKGQFSRVKTPSLPNLSGEYIEGEYTKNNYALMEDGKLKSIKRLDKEKLETHVRGNVIRMSDGTLSWEEDAEFGQYFLPKGITDASKAERDERQLVKAKSYEKILNNGESEMCSSFVIRMLHAAYAFEYMPEFQELLKKLKADFDKAIGDEEAFEKHQAIILHTLAEQMAEKILASDVGQRYFHDMNESVKVHHTITPDMVQEHFTGTRPGILSCMKRAWKTIALPKPRGFNEGEGHFNTFGSNPSACLGRHEQAGFHAGLTTLFGAAQLFLGVVAIPTALGKLAFNVTAATTGLLSDLSLSFEKVWEKEEKRSLLGRVAITAAKGGWDSIRRLFEYLGAPPKGREKSTAPSAFSD